MINKGTPQLALEFGRLFNEMKYYLRRNIQGQLYKHKINISFELLDVMAFLWRKDGMNQQELADMAIKDKSSMTYLIHNLVKLNLVKRIEDKTDRRNKLIFLTPKGKLLQEKLYPFVIELYRKSTVDVDANDIKKGISLLRKMNENLKGINALMI